MGLIRPAGTWMKTILETPRLRLRELVAGDLDFMAEMLADAEVMQITPSVSARDLSSEWIDRHIAWYKTDGYGLWLAEEREGGAVRDVIAPGSARASPGSTRLRRISSPPAWTRARKPKQAPTSICAASALTPRS